MTNNNQTAVFVTEKTTLIALDDPFSLDWEQFSWINDHDFLEFVSSNLDQEKTPKIKMKCNNAQVPSKWLRGTHYIFTYHEWVVLCQRFIVRVGLSDGATSFDDYRRFLLEASKKKVASHITDLTGLYRLADCEIFVLVATTKPHWVSSMEGKTSLEHLKGYWESLGIDTMLANLFTDISNEINANEPKE